MDPRMDIVSKVNHKYKVEKLCRELPLRVEMLHKKRGRKFKKQARLHLLNTSEQKKCRGILVSGGLVIAGNISSLSGTVREEICLTLGGGEVSFRTSRPLQRLR